MAQRQLGQTADTNASRALLNKHLAAIKQACGDHNASAFGTDLDGFIKPTIEGVQQASDLRVLADWIVKDEPDHAQAILYGNAQRVLKRAFDLRGAPSGRRLPAPSPSGLCSHPILGRHPPEG